MKKIYFCVKNLPIILCQLVSVSVYVEFKSIPNAKLSFLVFREKVNSNKGFPRLASHPSLLSPVMAHPPFGRAKFSVYDECSFWKGRGAFLSLLPLAGRVTSRWHLALKWKQKRKKKTVILSFQFKGFTALLFNSSLMMTYLLMIWESIPKSHWVTDTSKVERAWGREAHLNYS